MRGEAIAAAGAGEGEVVPAGVVAARLDWNKLGRELSRRWRM